MLRQALVYCRDILHTRLYRMPSGLLSWLDSGSVDARAAFDSVRDSMARIGRDFADMRITSHPDQFVVLSSDRPDVVTRAKLLLAGTLPCTADASPTCREGGACGAIG